jgi:hypothetical protein
MNKPPVADRFEGSILWILIVIASIVGVILFGWQREWVGLVLFAVSTALASAQLIRIRLRLRARASGGGGETGRRW